MKILLFKKRTKLQKIFDAFNFIFLKKKPTNPLIKLHRNYNLEIHFKNEMVELPQIKLNSGLHYKTFKATFSFNFAPAGEQTRDPFVREY